MTDIPTICYKLRELLHAITFCTIFNCEFEVCKISQYTDHTVKGPRKCPKWLFGYSICSPLNSFKWSLVQTRFTSKNTGNFQGQNIILCIKSFKMATFRYNLQNIDTYIDTKKSACVRVDQNAQLWF